MKTDLEYLSDYCSAESKYEVKQINVSDSVSLRIIRFTSAIKKDNPVIVFVPGWISLISGWKRALREMTKDFSIYYVETREKITSCVKGSAEYSVTTIGLDIVNLVSKLHLKENQYILFGSSLGATAILDCVRFLKSKPLCLVLIGPNAHFRIPKLGKVVIRIFPPRLYLLIKPVIKWYLKTFRLDVKNDYAQYEKYCGYLDSANPWKLKKAALSLSKYTVWNALNDIRCSTLIVGASKDVLHEPENLQRMASILKDATYLDLETNTRTHSQDVVEEVRKYIRNLNTRKQPT